MAMFSAAVLIKLLAPTVIIGTVLAMIAAWVWAAGELRAGRALLPPPPEREVPWGGASVLAVFLCWIVLNVGIPEAYDLARHGAARALRARPDRGPLRPFTVREKMLLIAVVNGCLVVLIPLLLKVTSRARLEHLGLSGADLGRHVDEGMRAFLLIAPVVYAINALAVQVWAPHKHPMEEMVRFDPTRDVAYLALVSGVVLAPAAEEMLFRGVIQGWLAQWFRTRAPAARSGTAGSIEVEAIDLEPESAPAAARSWWLPRAPGLVLDQPSPREAAALPVVLTSAFFALVHLPQWPAPLAIFVLSMGLGTVYQRTGSLVASFTMHALFNGFSTFILFAAVLSGDLPAP
jgi:membrane protease YdiL (CAAX protease family)